HLEARELYEEVREPLGPALRKARLEYDVLAFHVTKFAQASPECIGEFALRMLGREGRYQTYPRDLPTLRRHDERYGKKNEDESHAPELNLHRPGSLVRCNAPDLRLCGERRGERPRRAHASQRSGRT